MKSCCRGIGPSRHADHHQEMVVMMTLGAQISGIPFVLTEELPGAPKFCYWAGILRGPGDSSRGSRGGEGASYLMSCITACPTCPGLESAPTP